MRDYDLYLFDFDNTLYDTSEGIREILRHALSIVGVPYSESLFGELIGMDMRQIFDHVVGDPSLFDAYKDEFMRIVATDVYMSGVPFPETAEVLRELKARGKHIGIVSGKMRYKIVNLLERDGLSDIPECIVGLMETEKHKPDAEPILYGMSFFDMPASEILYIGDSPNDAGCARNAGIDCAIVDRTGDSPVSDEDCDYRIGSLNELLLFTAVN